MEFLIGVIVVVGVAWLFMSGTFKTSIKDTATLREHELEDVFIDLKKRILVTNAYEQDATYQRIYYRLADVQGQILERHKHFVLDVESQPMQKWQLFNECERRDGNGMRQIDYDVKHDLNLAGTRPEVLLYLCFFLWHGGQAVNVGRINSNTRMLMKILDHLISERKFAPGSFFKGMVRKYGETLSEPGDRVEAKQLLEFARDKGVGAATIELQHLPKFIALDGMSSVNI